MRLMTFMAEGKIRYGALLNDGVMDLSATLGAKFQSIGALLSANAFSAAEKAAKSGGPVFDIKKIKFLPIIPEATRILCVGLNYPKRHPLGSDVAAPGHPSIFSKVPEAIVPHGTFLRHPAASHQFDYEGELAIIIGREGANIAADDAFSHVAGYTCFNDGSARDFQKHSLWAGKNFLHSGAWGPWMTTADEIPDPAKLNLVTRLNGLEVQRASIGEMFFGVPEIIEYISGVIPLLPGDVIATGSPERRPTKSGTPEYLSPGDRVEIELDRIGVLQNEVA